MNMYDFLVKKGFSEKQARELIDNAEYAANNDKLYGDNHYTKNKLNYIRAALSMLAIMQANQN